MASAHLTKLKRKATELEQKKQFEKALGLYIQVIEEAGRDLDDADLQLYNRVGDLLLRQNNTSEALAYYEKAVDMYAERGFLNNAIALCNKILRQSPARTAVYYKLGKISASKGFKSDARKNFLEYADRMQKGGNLDEAFRALKEFADICPDQDDIRLMLADLLTRENRTSEAVEQLEQLYAKLDAEGRAAEARATMDRIKAIDPEITPRTTGTWQAQKSNDLVYLDLGEAALPAARAGTPVPATPVEPLRAIDTIDVSGVAALQGLTITFLPDEDPAPIAASADTMMPFLEGLEVTDVGEIDAPVPILPDPDLVTSVSLTPRDVEQLVAMSVDHPEFETPDDVVPPEVGLASSVVTLTGAHPSLAPLIDEPPLTGAEFGALHLSSSDESTDALRPHDLALDGSLPLLDAGIDESPRNAPSMSIVAPGLLEETPDEWVKAALQGPTDDLSLDRLLTPLDSPAIADPEAALPDVVLPGEGRIGSRDDRLSGSFSVDELLAIPQPDLPALGIDAPESAIPKAEDASGESAHDTAIALDAAVPGEPLEPASTAGNGELDSQASVEEEGPRVPDGEADIPYAWRALDDPAISTMEAEGEGASPEADRDREAPSLEEDSVAAEGAEEFTRPTSTGEAAPSWPAPMDATVDGEDVAARPTPAWTAGSGLPPEFALEGLSDDAIPSVLDTGTLRSERPEVAPALMPHAVPESQSDVVGEPSVAPEADGVTPGEPEEDAGLVRSAFDEDRVELPLLDLEAAVLAAETDALSEDSSGRGIDDLLNSPASFGDGGTPTAFEPAPLDLASGATDEWGTPEVLIDGEWRDEHVGDLVSGEMFVVGERRDAGPPRSPHFDDLAAAMLYEEDDDDRRVAGRTPTPSLPFEFGLRPGAPRGTLSFGGVEAQLRRRLELAPSDTALRRQLGEALLDSGDREGGLTELEVAVREYEGQNDLERAREIVDVILRVVPLSVRHHQKRVEYAVRSSDRPKLIEAYTELADALFRCGEPDKARVVYSRVLDLSPSNDRARFALSMLSEEAGLPRQSDEIPTIDTGILRGTPSVVMAMLTPEALEALTSHDVPEDNGLKYLATSEALAPASPGPEAPLDEVDAAFAQEPPAVTQARRRTEELEAVEEWAATQPPTAKAPAAAQGDFIDLGDWLRATEPEKSTRMLAADVAPTGDEGADFAEMLRRFKAGVAANVEDDDFASHYDLGVAYKEMGLVDEAIAQFQRSLRGEDQRIRSYEALGQCFVEKRQYPVAIALLKRAVEAPGIDDQRLVGVLYLLGFASESVGRQDDAVGYYQRVFAVDIQFRDVSSRLAALGRDAK